MIEKDWFDKLSAQREAWYNGLGKRMFSNFQDLIQNLNSEKAQFIIELIQNAEDASATYLNFILDKEGIKVVHNGKDFTCTNPNNEIEDQKSGSLGSINAITSYKLSNKSKGSIGKFGLGFKTVFVYTKSPSIYSKNYCFEITNYIVPHRINDLKIRKKNQTIYYLPFNSEVKNPEKSFSEIKSKLESLTFPLLFLSSIKSISWEIVDRNQSIKKSFDAHKNIVKSSLRGANVRRLTITSKSDREGVINNFLSVSRKLKFNGLIASICFLLDDSEKVIPIKQPVYCYFPTREKVNFNFLIHGPFSLTENREGVIKSLENESIISELADLVVDGFKLLKEKKYLEDDTIQLLLNKPDDQSIFYPIFIKLKEAIQTQKLLPSNNGNFVLSKHAFWAEDNCLIDLFSNEQLKDILGLRSAFWVFPSYSMKDAKDEFIIDLIKGLVSVITFEEIARTISVKFVEKWGFAWIEKLYLILNSKVEFYELLKLNNAPIYLNKKGRAVKAFHKYEDQLYSSLYLNVEKNTCEDIELHQKLHNSNFIKSLNIPEFNEENFLNKTISIKYKSPNHEDSRADILIAFEFWKENKRALKNIFADLFILRENKRNKRNKSNDYNQKPTELYFPNERLKKYFSNYSNAKFLDIKYYQGINEFNKDWELFIDFIKTIGVNFYPKIISNEIIDIKIKKELDLPESTHGFDDRNHTIDRDLDGLCNFLQHIDKPKSIILWELLIDYILELGTPQQLQGLHTYFIFNERKSLFDSKLIKTLKSEKWIFNLHNEPFAPQDILERDLPKYYKKCDSLCGLLGLIDSNFNDANISIKQTIELPKSFKNEDTDYILEKQFFKETKYSLNWFKLYVKLLIKSGLKNKGEVLFFQSISFVTNNSILVSDISDFEKLNKKLEEADEVLVDVTYEDSSTDQNLRLLTVHKVRSGFNIIFNNEVIVNKSIDSIVVKFSPNRLADCLEKSFNNKEFIDYWDDFKLEFPRLHYIYGPPGTGKTAKITNTIISKFARNKNCRILILTPTNKAADIIAKRLIDSDKKLSVLRLGRSTDPDLSDKDIYKNILGSKEFETLNVLITTIHRVPYTNVTNGDFLFQYKWDCVYFEEASMIDLAYLTFVAMAIKKSNPDTNLVIVGDPKQIPPIEQCINTKEFSSVNVVESIYSAMGIKSFKNVSGEVRKGVDTIECLFNQKRSVPEIGNLFSKFSYDGLLKHDDKKPNPDINKCKVFKHLKHAVNLINVPLNEKKPIFKIWSINNSKFHIYGSLLVFNLIHDIISTKTKSKLSIGCISPYDSQVKILERMISTIDVPTNFTIDFHTIHGAQGSEYDIVFFISNTTNYIDSVANNSLLSKEFIINVGISRAKEKLIIIYPFSASLNNNNFRKIKHIQMDYLKGNYGILNEESLLIDSRQLEALIFGRKQQLEKLTEIKKRKSYNARKINVSSNKKYFFEIDNTVSFYYNDI